MIGIAQYKLQRMLAGRQFDARLGLASNSRNEDA